MLTCKFLKKPIDGSGNIVKETLYRMEEPVIRTTIKTAMGIVAFQFIMSRTINEILKRARKKQNSLNHYSFDMLGEVALILSQIQVMLSFPVLNGCKIGLLTPGIWRIFKNDFGI